MALSLESLLTGATTDEAAAFVGYLVLEAGDDAEIDPALEPHLARFISAAGLLDRDLDEEGRQAAVDAFFRAHPIPAALQDAFAAQVAVVSAKLTRSEAAEQRAAAGLLGAARDVTPVGHQHVEGAVRGGVAALLQARTSNRTTRK